MKSSFKNISNDVIVITSLKVSPK